MIKKTVLICSVFSLTTLIFGCSKPTEKIDQPISSEAPSTLPAAPDDKVIPK